jgi:hypothetical protein
MAEDKNREIRISLPEELFAFLMPQETQQHLWRARKEILLALRAMIDARIEMIERKESGRAAAKKKIKVE